MWIPPHVPHAVSTRDCVAFHSLYLDAAIARDDFERRLRDPLRMTPLRELVLATAELPVNYDETGPDGALVCLIADRIARMRQAPLTVPLPRDPRSPVNPRVRCSVRIRAIRAIRRHIRSARRDARCRGCSGRTGLSFTEWRQAVRLLASLPGCSMRASRRGGRAPGYDSTSSFIALFQAKFHVTPGAYAKREARRLC